MYKLYNLIWQRFVASQMEAAVYDTLQVEVTGKTNAHEYLLRASGSAVKFPGFLVVYEEAKNEDVKTEEEENVKIPASIAEGQKQNLVRLIPEQHFTQPPPRYSEASLVQALEEDGIGRPSTYAPTISTIQQRGYVERVEKRLDSNRSWNSSERFDGEVFSRYCGFDIHCAHGTRPRYDRFRRGRMDGSDVRVLSSVCRGCEKGPGGDARYQVGA